MRTGTQRKKMTPPQVAERFGVDVAKVHAWIRAGELRAIDGATRRGERPRYLVDVDDLEAFERARAVVVAEAPRPAKPKTPAGLVRNFR